MDNPWGDSSNDSDDVGLTLPASAFSAVPSSTVSSSSFTAGSNGWTDEPGWGSSTFEDTDVAALPSFDTSATTTTTSNRLSDSVDERLGGVDEPASLATSFNELSQEPSSVSRDDADRGWNVDGSPDLPRPSLPSFSPSIDSGARDEFSTPALATSTDDTASEADSAGGWAPVGSPVLPPVSSLALNDDLDANEAGAATSTTRIDAWQPEEEWSPPDVPEPLPSFGDAFDKARRRPSVASSEDGWGGGVAHARSQSWNGGHEESVQEEEGGGTYAQAFDSAAFDDGRRTPIAHAFDEQQSQEVDGDARESGQDQHEAPAIEPEAAQPTAKAAAARTWWRRGGSNATDANATAAKQEAAATQAASRTEPAPHSASADEQGSAAGPSAFGRLIGRFKRQSAASENASGQRSARNSSEEQHAASAAASLPAEWEPKDLDALEAVSKRAEPVFAAPAQSTRSKAQSYNDDDDDGEVELYDTRKSARRHDSAPKQVPAYEPEDDFGGLIGSFSQAPARTSLASKPRTSTLLDPFDPFADDSVDQLPAPSTARRQTRAPAAFSAPSVPVPTGRVGSFPSSFAAPQARGVSNVVAAPAAVDHEDSFDAFFDSVANSTQRSRTPTATAAGAAVRPTVSIPRYQQQPPASPLRTNANKSPLHALPRMSPPPKSSSPIAPLAPPPPPSQPVTRVSPVPRFDTASPPTAAPDNSMKTTTLRPELLAAMSKPLVASRSVSVAAGSVPAKSTPPAQQVATAASSGGLSKDDFDFFES
ncbi:hypothetical protein ACM66B_000780 [Microbotryomycetes sp. NB124-2]